MKDPDLRLRFVDWNDFQKGEQFHETGMEARDRIRKRQALSQQRPLGEEEAESERDTRAKRRIVEEIRRKLEDIVREDFIRSELFTPIEVHEFADEHPNKAGFLVFVKASQQLGLSYSVSLVFYAELLDAQSEAITLSFAVAISDVRPSRDSILAGARSTFFEGVFEESTIRPIVENVLYPALDLAQQIDRNTSGLSGSPLKWLALQQAEKHE